jgi:bifunctional UDP-N-acetylglucosamine pyrophosphorylase / glucosamine-1-phosphate N-acetyltransferase
MKNLNVVILAAGKGTRMHSAIPKVLHKIANKPILEYVIECARKLNPTKIIIVYGYGGQQVKNTINHQALNWVEQIEQKGTGHAVQQAIPLLDEMGNTLVMLGDVPLVNELDCEDLIKNAANSLGILTLQKDNPTGYGRIIRESGRVIAIVEEKDASNIQREIKEVNTGIMAMPNHLLKNWLSRLTNQNAQQEFYLTDIVKYAVEDGVAVEGLITHDEWSVTGINSKVDLEIIERVYQQKIATGLLKSGVTLRDSNRIDVRGELICGKDVSIDINCLFEGKVTLGDHVEIGANCIIKNASIASGTKIEPFSHIDTASIGPNSRIGPYARLRPGSALAGDNHIGNFVELKNANVDTGSKINHLSYIGDATIGKSVNIGAGTITCNYDGSNKFQTIIEDGAFIGSDSQLIAPVTIGKDATIAAGSTITKNAPAGQLTVCRTKVQQSIDGWKRPAKIKKE